MWRFIKLKYPSPYQHGKTRCIKNVAERQMHLVLFQVLETCHKLTLHYH